TRGYNKSSQGGGSSESESYDSRDLVTVDELPIIMKAKGKSKKYGGYCILFVDEYRPFFVLKHHTLKHPRMSEVGSSFPQNRHNNTDIEKEYSGYDDRVKAHKERMEAVQKSDDKTAKEVETDIKEKEAEKDKAVNDEMRNQYAQKPRENSEYNKDDEANEDVRGENEFSENAEEEIGKCREEEFEENEFVREENAFFNGM
ncbi:MAG: hypothetical protein LBI36_00335, partial [Oscillospiraceae bacterium]|nr:hypothetical protein [Oscillospiraceae bacterium]